MIDQMVQWAGWTLLALGVLGSVFLILWVAARLVTAAYFRSKREAEMAHGAPDADRRKERDYGL